MDANLRSLKYFSNLLAFIFMGDFELTAIQLLNRAGLCLSIIVLATPKAEIVWYFFIAIACS